MAKRWIAAIGILTMLWAVTACAGGSDSGNAAQRITSYANEPADLVIFGQVGNTEEQWNERFGNAIKKHFPNYKITYIQRNDKNKLSDMIASGQSIDLIHDSAGGMNADIIQNGFEYDLANLVKKHNVDLNRIEPNVLQAVSNAGKLYGIPLHGGGLVLYYNKDIFDKFGLPYPKDGMTWDEAIELGKKLTRYEDGKQFIGLGVSNLHVLLMNPFSLPVVDPNSGKADLNNEQYKKLIQTVILAPRETPGYKEYMATLKRSFNNNDFMKTKTMAMFVMNFYLQMQPDFDKLNWDMVSLPVFKDKPGIGSQPYPNALFLSSTSKYKDQAMEVLKYIASDEFQMNLSKNGWVPVLKNETIRNAFAQNTNYKDKNVIKALFTNKPAAPSSTSAYDNVVRSILLKHINSVLFDGTDLNTALGAAQEEADQSLAAVQGK